MEFSGPEYKEFIYGDGYYDNTDLEQAMLQIDTTGAVNIKIGDVMHDDTDWEDQIARRIDGLCAMAGLSPEIGQQRLPLMVDIFAPSVDLPWRGQYGRKWSDQTIGEVVTSVTADVDPLILENFGDEGKNGGTVAHSFYIPAVREDLMLCIDTYTTHTDDTAIPGCSSGFYALYGSLEISPDAIPMN